MSRSTDPFADADAVLEQASETAREWVRRLATQPVSRRIGPTEMAELLNEPLPEHGTDARDVVQAWLDRARGGIVASPGPRFFGFVNGGSTPAALAGDWLASAIDQNAGFWLSSPAAAQTELVVLDWLKSLFHLPTEWHGAITSGATMSNLVGLAAARQWAGNQLGFDPALDGLAGHPPIPVISSTEIHASARKALGTLGIGRASVQEIAAPGGAIDLDELRAALEALDGPAIVIANAGEVNTGAFDAIDKAAAICRAHAPGVWLHVDGAFGLFAAASPQLRPLVAGIEQANSVAADGHKWLNVPYDSGFAFVRDVDMLRAAFNAIGPYIAPAADTGWEPASHVPEMSRRFRALPAWCALKAYGRDGYRDLVERCCSNAGSFGEWVESTPGIELLAPVPLNIVCFRVVAPDLAATQLDALNAEVAAAIQRDGRAFVTGTSWRGQYAIRAAFDNWATTQSDVEILQQAVLDARDLVLQETTHA
ncbi:MAG: pyridoxal-dependent decarboxylase [Thermomicrobiales bacterium]|nr:pyridoxal-dependent decarboxylase [Thermomicrobiales bacterium]